LHKFILIFVLLSATLTVSLQSAPAAAQLVSSNLLQQKTQAACSFLKTLYNPSLGLVRNLRNSNAFYIGDNLLAQRAFSNCDPATSQAINQSISSCCSRGKDGLHEVLLGVKIPLPITTPLTNTVADSSMGRLFRGVTPAAAGGNYTVLWIVYDAGGVFPDCEFADVTAYTALELKLEGNTTGAQHEMDCLNIMYDGHGMADEGYKGGVFIQSGVYQTESLALYVYALQKISGVVSTGAEENLLRMQSPDGGFHTGYDQMGTYGGSQENAETTADAIIALSSLTTTSPFLFRPVSIPGWIVYLFASWAIISVGVVAFVLLYERRKRQRALKITSQAKAV
jgi:hypothetical protein